MQVIILAGGSGTRFWPASRRRRPKQLLALDGAATLLEATVERLGAEVAAEDVWVCTNRSLADEVRRQLPAVPAAQVLAEPAGRNTLPAVAWTVRAMPPERRQEVALVLPADHRVADPQAFRRAAATAATAVAEGGEERVVTLGVTPRWPETGYGYLEMGEVLDAASGLRRVRRFTEKPDRPTAEGFVESGRYLWNAGIFLFRGTTLLELTERYEPEIARGLATLERRPERLEEVYPALPSQSIDFGIMERHGELVALPLDCGWSDLGSWTALAEVLPTDEAGNAIRGDVLALDADDNLLYCEDGSVAVLGVSGLVVVRTADVVLVVPKERAQEVRRVVAALRAGGRDDLL